MSQDDQQEFLFADGDLPRLGMPRADDPLVSDIARVWGLPIGRKVRIHLKDGENLSVLDGRLELASAPDHEGRDDCFFFSDLQRGCSHSINPHGRK
jgi:hypothetical protein